MYFEVVKEGIDDVGTSTPATIYIGPSHDQGRDYRALMLLKPGFLVL